MPGDGGDEPVNLLSLDGGGIRGVSELVILDAIMKEIQKQESLDYLPKPCDYFNLIGGTSTGGLISIMLGRLRMTTEEALREYIDVGGKIFSRKNFGYSLARLFREDALKHAIEDLVNRRGTGALLQEPDPPHHGRGKAFVCAMPSSGKGAPRRFRTYPAHGDHGEHIEIWEAARATTAASVYFRRMTIASKPAASATDEANTSEDFIDGAIKCNNPAWEVLKEARLLWDAKQRVNSMISLGTGLKDVSLETNPDKHTWNFLKSVLKLGKSSLTDSERTHNDMLDVFEGWPDTYFRFNLPQGAEKVGLASYKKMGELVEMTREYVKQEGTRKMVTAAAELVRSRALAGPTMGHIFRSKEQLVDDQRVAQPQGRTSHIFTGRGDILGKLNSFFGPRDSAKPRREFLLCGLGGMGKTQIALKFVEDHEDRFQHVFWVDATDKITAEQSYKDIASGLFNNEDGESKSVERVLKWLAASQDEWLIVFDNFDAQGDLAALIPSGNKGNILYTSRHHGIKQTLSVDAYADVEEMDAQNSTTLLLRAAKIDESLESARETASSIVKELGYLPLAIDQAGAYVYMDRFPLDDYLDKFRKHRKWMMQDSRFRGASERNQAVYATFEISYRAIATATRSATASLAAHEARSALKLLSTVCFYHHEGIARQMFQRSALNRCKTNRGMHFPLGRGERTLEDLVTVTDGAWDSMDFDLGADLLDRYSLIKRNRDGSQLFMHVLVHAWARDRMTIPEYLERGLAARNLMADSIPRMHENRDAYIYRRKLLPHLIACVQLAPLPNEDEILNSEYDENLAIVTQQEGLYDSAEILLKLSLERRKKEYMLHGRPTLALMSKLAALYAAQGRYADAEFQYWQTIELRKIDDGDEVLFFTIRDKWRLANLYTHMTSYKKAERLMVEVVQKLEDRQKLEEGSGEDSKGRPWDLIMAKSNLAGIRGSIVGRQRSVAEVKEELEAAQRFCGEDSMAVLSMKYKLAAALANDRKYKEAEVMAREVYEALKEIRGEEAQPTIEALCVIATCIDGQGDVIGAEQLYRQVVEMGEKVYPVGHPTRAYNRAHLAVTILAQGRIEEGFALLAEALADLEANLDPKHIAVVEFRLNIARYRDMIPRITPELRERWKTHPIDMNQDVGDMVLGTFRPPDGEDYTAVDPDESRRLPEWEYVPWTSPADVFRREPAP